MDCPECGFPLGSLGQTRCPKCDCEIFRATRRELYRVDLAHDGETWSKAQAKLDRAISHALAERYRGVKVIHGYGSEAGHTAILKGHVIGALRRFVRERGGRMAEDGKNPGAHILYF